MASVRFTITNSTISGNRANRGGGVYNSLSTLGGPGTLTLNNSLIAGNQAVIAPEIENFSRAIVNANNFNLVGANGNAGVIGFAPGPTDIVPSVSVEQILGPLKHSGGPTPTHALKPGSPALDAVPLLDPGCSGTDQRGITRPQGTACDVGAFEGAIPGSIPVSDFDGDGETDVAVYQTNTGNWFYVASTSGSGQQLNFGGANFLPVPGDYDGDGETDTAVYQASTGDWFIAQSTTGIRIHGSFGGSGFVPVLLHVTILRALGLL